jgi:hypothetical protein
MTNSKEQASAQPQFASSDESVSSLDALRKLMQSNGDSSFLSKMFQSNTATATVDDTNSKLFKSGDSASFLSNLMKSSDLFKSGESTGSSFLTNLVKSSDIFKSNSTNTQVEPALINSKIPDVFSSRDWASAYQPKHAEVDVQHVFESTAAGDATTSATTAAPAGKTDWNALYEAKLPAQVLPPTMVPLSRASGNERDKEDVDSDDEWQPDSKSTRVAPSLKKNTSCTKRKRSRPNLEPPQKVFVEPIDLDVLMGRGGRTNHHPGNKKYLDAKEGIQDRYMAANKNAKTAISQELVDQVHAWGGRFLKMDEAAQQWYPVVNIVARKKASQTLREINSAEERAAKRAKYTGN